MNIINNYIKPNKYYIIYFIIRVTSIFFLFNLAPDISRQLNVTMVLKNYGIYGLKIFDINTNTYHFLPYYSHPPFFSLIIYLIDFLFNNIIYSTFFLGVIIAAIETNLVGKILKKFINIQNQFTILFLLCSLYIGHIDRGTISDYFSIILGLALFLQMLKLIDEKTVNILGTVIIIFLVPFSKYSIFPIVISFAAIYLYVKIQCRQILQVESFILGISTLISMIVLVYLKNKGVQNVLNNNNTLYLDLYNISKVDYFWFHFGLEIDRFYKHLMWFAERILDVKIWFWYFGQFFGVITLALIITKSKKFIAEKKAFFYGLIVFSFFQYIFLFLLQITTPPEQNVLFGVDDLVWVFSEEARYYNYLTLIWFIVLSLGLLNIKNKLYFGLLIILISFGYVKTMYAASDGFSDLKILELSKQLKIVESLGNSPKRINKFYNTNIMKQHKKEYDKNILLIFGIKK
jgi:hypothetical protein